MIKIIDYADTYKHRATGWVQDSASFENLHSFVSIFSRSSFYRSELLDRIERLVESQLGQHFAKVLNQPEIEIVYRDIVGTTPKGGRKNTVCDGIGQAALKGQKREFQGNWSTDSFLRWAEVLQFVEFSPATDTYKITVDGEAYVGAAKDEQYQIIKKQVLMYPPAIRILGLLNDSEQTKFSLGEKLGFIGEEGFTNVPEKLFIDMYLSADPASDERKRLKANYEGSSDKYARQICSWLIKIELVELYKKQIIDGAEKLSLSVYKITPQGREYLRKARINTRRFVPFRMLSMESSDKERICKRRALLIKALSDGLRSIEDIFDIEKKNGIDTAHSEISDDILSLQSMGLDIVQKGAGFQLKNTIIGLSIPRLITLSPLSAALEAKKRLRNDLKYIDHNLLVLIDFAYGSRQSSRLFEVYVAKAYKQLYPETFLLGGISKPDIVVCADSFVLIIDAKAYAKGFGFPQPERDKMVRYIGEYKQKKSTWYKLVEESIRTDNSAFQFVSAKFSGAVDDKLADIAQRAGVNGSAIAAEDLLRVIDKSLTAKKTLDFSELSSNSQIAST